MTSNLTQRQIDHLDDYEYSLFLAYGDAYKPTPTVPSRNRKRSAVGDKGYTTP